LFWKTGWLSVAVESEVLGQLEQADVVEHVARIVARMDVGAGDLDALLAAFTVMQLVLAGNDLLALASVGEAMGGGQDPSLADDRPSAEVAPRLDTHLPRERSSFGSLASDDVAMGAGRRSIAVLERSFAALPVAPLAAFTAATLTAAAASTAVLFISTIGAIVSAIANSEVLDASPSAARTAGASPPATAATEGLSDADS